MTITVVRKRGSQVKKAVKKSGLFNLLVRRSIPIPPVILLLIILIIWCSSTLFSISFFHVCISSRKLNLYCVTAGTRPDFPGILSQKNYVEKSTAANTTNATGAGKYEYAITKKIDMASIKDVAEKESISTTTATTTDTIAAAISTTINPDEVDKKKITHVVDRIDLIKADIEGVANNVNKSLEDEIVFAVNTVKEQLRTLRSSSTSGSRNVTRSCDGRGVFVYDLPPKFNKDLVQECGNLFPWEDLCDYLTNDAMGKPIPALGKGWHNTHQYSLELIFHSRVLNHPCRVYNTNEANLFYVPFYGGMDILRWHFKNVSNEVKDELGLELLKWMQSQNSWARNSGKDHVFVLGKISWDFRRKQRDAWGTNFLELDQLQNPLKLLIERQPWHMNDIGVPHPTHFHPHSDQDIIQWQSKLINSERRHLVSFAGGARPEAPLNIRSVLIEQCKTSAGHCRFVDCKSGECSKPEAVIDLFMESEFCLQPPGDSPTRKSVFDSLVAGCIPVLFDPFTAYYQYPWHLPEDHTKYSEYIDQEEVRQMKVDVVERLSQVSITKREEMRKYIVYELMPGLVYGDSTSEFEKFEDSFIISMNNLHDRVRRSIYLD
ncbi:probable xyloglucan galactosyltransferase GT20 [Aristolochia californica]|uniref:probable xyloglucan galactosyltransferase GT20 n=1 Tax=Aristolochia californica TaxID=171875 RepID=UPI0035E1B2A8